jgi:2,4'-dihydroxyacetophenone dioxygenase
MVVRRIAGRVIFWVQPWAPAGCGQTTSAMVVRRTDIVFTITGSIEFLNDDDSLKFTLDVFSFAQMYYDHCKEKGIKPNDTLWH